MSEMPVTRFKATCLKVLDSVHRTGESVVVVRRGTRLAKVVPLADSPGGKRKLGTMAGEAVRTARLVGKDFGDHWESLK